MNKELLVSSKLRLAFLGDSITVGDGDKQARGWPSRICETTSPIPEKTHCYNLGVGGDRIVDLAGRIGSELKARLTGRTGRGVIIMIGLNDALRASAITNRIPLEPNRIKIDLTKILKEAKSYGAIQIVEPTPVLPEFENEDGVKGKVVLQHLVHINQLLLSVCEAEDIPLLSLTEKLQTDPEFITALRSGDGLHPADSGYDRIAKHISVVDSWITFLRSARKDI